MNHNLEQCRKSLLNHLERRRQIFPRFYFLSMEDVLHIVCNGKLKIFCLLISCSADIIFIESLSNGHMPTLRKLRNEVTRLLYISYCSEFVQFQKKEETGQPPNICCNFQK